MSRTLLPSWELALLELEAGVAAWDEDVHPRALRMRHAGYLTYSSPDVLVQEWRDRYASSPDEHEDA